jgi:hypothetical protein
MNLRTPHALAALLLASAAPFAFSQPLPPAGLVEEPVASASRSDAVADAIVQELNADASLKHSKITVQPDESGVFLSGSTLTDAQARRAIQVASAHAGQGKVSSGILSSEIVLWAPPPQEPDGLAEPAAAEPAVSEPAVAEAGKAAATATQ